MKKTYIEANYRIKDLVYNHGYICIDRDSINGIFSLDCVYIKINNGYIHFYLKEYSPEYDAFYETEEFTGKYNIKTLESPHTYIFKSSSNNKIISLELIKKVTNPKILSDIEKDFKAILGK